MLWSCLLEVLHLYLVGVTVLPDLAVDIVLAQTSSDEEDITEPDSAGEIHPGRRKTLRRYLSFYYLRISSIL